MTLCGIMRIGHSAVACAIFRRPLVRAGGTLCQLPLVAEQVGEKVVAPLGWSRGPCDFQATADGVATMALAKFILPAEALILDVCTLWFVANVIRGDAGTVSFAEGVSARNECDGFFVVHRHAGEGFSDIASRGDGIGLAIGSFGIHVDQAHLHRAERLLQVTISGVALVREPCTLRTPVQLFGLPHVGAAAGKAERLEAHRFKTDVAGENHQVGPGKFLPILLLDRPQQATRLVEVYVVGPAVERSEALLAGSGATAAV